MLNLLKYMKVLPGPICGILLFFGAHANGLDSVQEELDRVIKQSLNFEQKKLARINKLKAGLAKADSSLEHLYVYYSSLYQEYEKFQLDSAMAYVEKNLHIATMLQDTFKLNQTRLMYIRSLSAAGKFVEAKGLLDEVSLQNLDAELKADYYRVQTSFYSQYGLSSNNSSLFQLSEEYRDSLLQILDQHALDYQISLAVKWVYAKDFNRALPILHHLCDSLDDSNEDRALVAYLLGVSYGDLNQADQQIKYFAVSAICDIKNAIKDNASMQSLAMAYYERGDVDRASLFIEKAVNDAIFSNVRFRTIESSSFYPIIHSAFAAKEQQRNQELVKFLTIISLLSALLLLGVAYIYKQVVRLRKVRQTLDRTNDQLSELNEQLLSSNELLQESNHVKEEYIAQFFDICSSYINKMDVMRKDILKKVTSKSQDSLKKELQSSQYLKSELEDLYHHFDVLFITLYPNFVSDFNTLLVDDEKIVLKPNELLNSELRIYALIRLGITDNTKIASFLRYSLRTVYNYRVKTRNKVKGSRSEFENTVMTIGNSY